MHVQGQFTLDDKDVMHLLAALALEMQRVESAVRKVKDPMVLKAIMANAKELLRLSERLIAFRKDLEQHSFKLRVRRV